MKLTNIEEQLKKKQQKNISETEILKQVKAIFDAENEIDSNIQTRLSSNNNNHTNKFNIDLLESDRIYHVNTIKSTCIDYRLRFLDTQYFKNDFPHDAIIKIKALERTHNIKLDGFKIMAPSKLFRLKNPDDPLLFAPIGNGYYYLIHKWGNDLHPLRKWLMLPFKNYENLMLFAIAVSFFLTTLFNIKSLSASTFNTNFFLLFLFMFKSVVGIVIYYAFSQGKNVNTEIWNSKYSK